MKPQSSSLMTIMHFIIRKKPISIDKSKIHRILILRLDAIGDVLRTTPLIRELRKIFPKAEIDYIVSSNSKGILVGNPNINNIIPINTKIGHLSHITRVTTYFEAAINLRKNKYDLLINLEPHWLSQFFTLLLNIPISIGFDRAGEGFALNNKIPYDGSKNEIFKNLEILKFFGKTSRNTKLDIFIPKKDIDFAESILKKHNLYKKKVIGFAPGISDNTIAEERYREWPKEKYAKLCKILINKGFFLVFIGTKKQKKLIKDIIKNLNTKDYLNMVGKTTIMQAAAFIKNCNLFIGGDSGPIHIAAATNTNIIALFGPTSPKRAAPLTKNTYIIYKKKNNEPEKYDIYGRYLNCKNETYMERIFPQDILKVVYKIIKK